MQRSRDCAGSEPEACRTQRCTEANPCASHPQGRRTEPLQEPLIDHTFPMDEPVSGIVWLSLYAVVRESRHSRQATDIRGMISGSPLSSALDLLNVGQVPHTPQKQPSLCLCPELASALIGSIMLPRRQIEIHDLPTGQIPAQRWMTSGHSRQRAYAQPIFASASLPPAGRRARRLPLSRDNLHHPLPKASHTGSQTLTSVCTGSTWSRSRGEASHICTTISR